MIILSFNYKNNLIDRYIYHLILLSFGYSVMIDMKKIVDRTVMKIIKIWKVLLLSLVTIVSNSYAQDEDTKGLLFKPAIKVKDKVTFDYINEMLSLNQANRSLTLENSISTTGLQSFESLKNSCYLEGASNTYLDFMNKNIQFANPKYSKSTISSINFNINKAKKINLGRCGEVSDILKKQFEIDKKIIQQELMNQLMNMK